jgi:hypothetical protein
MMVDDFVFFFFCLFCSDGMNMKDNATGKLLWECGSLGADIFKREIEGLFNLL